MSFLSRTVLIALTWLAPARRRIRQTGDAGMSTAEYAVGTVAAVAFAVVLYKIVRSDAVSATLSSIVRSALHAL
jgi:RsiW-degrading membrane proteinase PrsW (M82 family)